MSRRTLAVVTLAIVASSLTACADGVTAPAHPTLAPSAAPRHDAISPGTCKGGWIGSEGRCL